MDQTEMHPAWYVVHTRSRFEQVVFDGFDRKILEAFLPKITVMSKRRDRRKKIRIPLFPGYVFIRSDLNPHERLEIVKTTGVVRLVGNKDGPVPVPDDAIESLRIIIAVDSPVETGTRFKKGDRVMVVEGPFVGVTGIFVRYRGFGRVVVAIEALGQYAAVNVLEEHVERIPDFG
ncbi:MAG: UpxY family transcription antiterminator [Deltaproteobacteria bacterium]|jgi:transcription elongation factor/antiterminator RfaH